MPRFGKAKVLDEIEFERTVKLESVGQHAKRNIALLYISHVEALRAKEMAALKMKDVLLPNLKLLDEVNLLPHMTKGAKQRFMYLNHPKLRKVLEDYIKERMEEDGSTFNLQAPLFRSQKGGHFSPNSMQRLFAIMYKRAGLVGASSHSGRRTRITHWLNHYPIKTVSTRAGHSRIQTTAEYGENDPKVLKKMGAEPLF